MTIVEQEKPRMNGDLVDPNATPRYNGDFVPEERQRDMQTALNRHRNQAATGADVASRAALKNNSSTFAGNAKRIAELAKNPQKSAIKLVFGIFKQIDFGKDWAYLFLLIPFAILKDIFDIALAAIPGVGIAVSFITTIMLTIFTTICLLMMGESFSVRKSGKYIAGLGIEFISEAMPGIDWLPLATVETIVLYFFVLFDRVFSGEESNEQSQQPA
jgi:hypothetical protein